MTTVGHSTPHPYVVEMSEEEVIGVKLEKVHADLLDSFMPFLGTTRSEVAKNLIIRGIETEISNTSFDRLREYGAMKRPKL